MGTHELEQIRAAVEDRYGEAALQAAEATSAAGDVPQFGPSQYSPGDLAALPEAAVAASLGCGNPMALIELRAR